MLMNNKFEYITSKQLGDIRQQAEDRISQIRNTPNMTIPEGATTKFINEAVRIKPSCAAIPASVPNADCKAATNITSKPVP